MDRALIARIEAIPDAQFWETRQKVKSQMLRVLRDRLTRQWSATAWARRTSSGC